MKYHKITIYVPTEVRIPIKKIPELESAFRKRWDTTEEQTPEVADEDLLIEAQNAGILELPEDYRL